MKLKTLVTSLALQQIKEIDAVTKQGYHFRTKYWMHLQGTVVHYFDIKIINLGFSAFYHYEIMKTETV